LIDKALIKLALDKYKELTPLLEHNHVLFDIYEGSLLKYIEQDLQASFSHQSFEAIKPRIAPINILKRVVDKLSTLYSKPPKRTVVNGTEQDKELLTWYEENMHMNANMNIANELFNLHKTVNLEPYVDEMLPRLRSVPSDRSYVISTDPVDPTRPTAWVKIMGRTKYKGEDVAILYIYTNDDFIPVTSSGDVIENVLIESENLEATNVVGKIPSVYINRSYHCLIPPVDTDTLRMTKIIPILISDLNYAVMYQAFSLLYTIDVDTQNVNMSPNALWVLKGDGPNAKPQVGTVKPEVDITEVSQFIMSQFSMWLQSKGIRPGTIGQLAGQADISGLSKMMDEMDTSEDRQKQVQHFIRAEAQFWSLITKHMHPYWMANRMIDTSLNFSADCKIVTEFPEQSAFVKRQEIIDSVIKELEKGLTTKKRAIGLINPDMKEDEVDKLLIEIEQDRVTTIEVPDEEETGEENQEETEALVN